MFRPLKKADLNDPTLFELNRRMQFFYERLSLLFGATGSVELKGTISADAFRVTGQAPTTADPEKLPDLNEVLTVALAKRLFSPQVTRSGFVQGRWFGEPVQPIPITATGGGFLRATFVIPGAATVGIDVVDTRHIVTTDGRSPIFAAINAKVPPAGADLKVDVTYLGSSIFGTSKLVLPAGSSTNTVAFTTAFATPVPIFAKDTVLKCDVNQTGNAQGVEIVVDY